MDYKVKLENFAGPLDLLLFLVRKEEIDIHDIPISKVLEQYLGYLEILKELDLDDAGEFLVMAATLMVIKSKMLLPQEKIDLDQEIDPRFELVQQLLEYKKLKDRVSDLEQRAEDAQKRFGRPETARPGGMVEKDRSIDELSVFHLLESFQKLMEATGGGPKTRVVRVEDTPVRVWSTRLVDRLRNDRSVKFAELFPADATKNEKIGWFLAVLLLVKNEVAGVAQGLDGDIRLFFKQEPKAELVAEQDDFRP
ncbi:MAG: Segregation and condensation protein [Planctomycetota bacterium]